MRGKAATIKYIVLIVTLFIAFCIVFPLVQNSYNKMKSVNEFLQQQVIDKKTPSIQYAFFNVDTVIYQNVYGVSNVRKKTEAGLTTTYNLFSVTKTFTALAVLQLAQAGKIQLNKPISYYLPSFPYSVNITVEQLLNHSSGIPNPLPLRWIHLASEHNNFNRNIFFDSLFIKHQKLAFEPGIKFKYSNLGYVLLGQLIEKVSGQSYEDYVTKNIIQPCGIEQGSLGFKIDPSVHATGYHKWLSLSNALFGFLIDKDKFMGPKEGKWKPFNNFYTNGTPYGGIIGSVSGLIKYAQVLLQNNSLLINDTYKNILFTESIIENKPVGMSLSWYTGEFKGHKYYAHAGGGGGYYVELRLYPELGSGSVIMFNRSGMTDERILNRPDEFFIPSISLPL